MFFIDRLTKSPDQLFEIGLAKLFGTSGHKADVNQAYKYLKLSAEKGSEAAMTALAYFFRDDSSVLNEKTEKKYEEYRWRFALAEAGDQAAIYKLNSAIICSNPDNYSYHKALKAIKSLSDKGHREAMTLYAIELLEGKRFNPDPVAAVKLLRKAAEKGSYQAVDKLFEAGQQEEAMSIAQALADAGDTTAMRLLANFHFHLSEYSAMEDILEKAAQAGSTDAMSDLGVIYRDGSAGERNLLKAAAWFKRGAEAGDSDCMVYLANLLASDDDDIKNEKAAFEWFSKAADAGNPKALINLGIAYKLGVGTEASPERAMEYFLRAVETSEEAEACFRLFSIYAEKDYSDEIVVERLKWLKRAVALDHPEACFHMGLHYEVGYGVDTDLGEALEWFTKGASLGNARCLHKLGTIYHYCSKEHQEPEYAFRCLQRAAPELPEAMTELGICYSEGFGCEQDFVKALECYFAAAEADDADAYFHIGVAFRQGEGVEQDIPRAIEYYTEAINRGHSVAMVNCGILYDHGFGVEADGEKAANLYRQAAYAGNVHGMTLLGNLYYDGRHLERDYVEAVRWYMMAAEKGEGDAMFHLAFCYGNGFGVEEDLDKANNYLYRSARTGWEPALEFIKDNKMPSVGSYFSQPD